MLAGHQKKFLRGKAHRLKPVVLIGQNGLTDAVLASIDEALQKHELIKVGFNAFKDKDQKKEIIAAMEAGTASEMVGMVGHKAIFFRQHPDPEKRKIRLPHLKK